jgi:RiboL-PSP-HEPN
VTPKAAFDEIIGRAQLCLDLHDGLIDVRRRGIRSDWKESFCGLMHWPKGSNIERVDSRDAVVVLRDGCKLTRSSFRKEAMEELLRSALVVAVSALDRYVHERVVKKVVQALSVRDLNRSQRELAIPVSDALRIQSTFRKAVRTDSHVRPANEVRHILQESLHQRTFQSWSEIEYAFELVGVKGLAGQIQAATHAPTIQPLKKQLGDIARRRNQIVHEGDLVRHRRGGQPKRRPVDRMDAQNSISFIQDLIDALEKVV